MKKYFYYVLGAAVVLIVGMELLPNTGSATFASSGPQYFVAHMSCSGAGSCAISPGQEIAVPTGKKVFLQYASATASVNGIIPQQAMVRLTVPYFETSSTCSFYEYGLPLTFDGVIAGKSQFSAAQPMNVIVNPTEQTCSVQKGVGAYINSTSNSEDTVLEIHVSGLMQ